MEIGPLEVFDILLEETEQERRKLEYDCVDIEEKIPVPEEKGKKRAVRYSSSGERIENLGNGLTMARKLCNDLHYVRMVIEKVSQESSEYGFAMSAMLLSGARRGEIREMDIFLSPTLCRVQIPTLKQRHGEKRMRSIRYDFGSSGYNAFRHIMISSGCDIGWYTACRPFAMLSVQGLADAVRRARGTDKAMTLHTLRHLFATQARRSGWGVQELSDAMGHSRRASTKGYGI